MVKKEISSFVTNKLIWTLWIIQILLALSAFAYVIDIISDGPSGNGAQIFASLFTYIALVSIGYGLAHQIVDSDRSELSRLFSFIYYVVLTGILYFGALDPGALLVLGGLI